jgi:type IV pilus assembly protein PilB
MSQATPTGTPAPGGEAQRPKSVPAPGAVPQRPVPITRIPVSVPKSGGNGAPAAKAPISSPNGGQAPASNPSPAAPVKPTTPAPSQAQSRPVSGSPGSGGSAPGSAGGAAGLPPIGELKGRPLGRVLQKMGKVTREQYTEGLNIQKQKGGQLGRILIDMGLIREVDLNIALAAQQGYEVVSLEGLEIPADAIAALQAPFATSNRVLPLSFDKATKNLTVAMATHENFRALDDMRSVMGYQVTARIASDPDLLDKLIAKNYQTGTEGLDEVLGELQQDDSLKDLKNRGESIDVDSLSEAANSNPVRKLINLVLLQAIKDKASDIHFEPFEGEFKMRYRIDGVLYEMMPPPAHIAAAISSRIKVMANLDIAERRLPQDGRIELTVNNQPIDLRVSVLPTMFGESVVMRVLDRANVSLDLDKIGLREDDLNMLRQLIRKPNGICCVTGPTGSGKTTTLYSALRELNDPTSKLITAEDPVEYDIDGIIQCQIRPEIELTFARILRSMLRQDPDTILIGEIRDKETAEIAVQAALTGHLVFSTLHTNDAPSAIARLLDLGLEPFLVTATIEGIVAQRLVRKICLNCKTEYVPTEEQLMELELRPDDVAGKKFFYGKGCSNCNNTGYRGRMGLYEIMILDDDMRDQIIQHASTQVLRLEAKKRGMRSLRQCGLLAIYDGVTTIEEVVRETLTEDE